MPDNPYPPVTRGLIEARRALASGTGDASRAFSRQVYADGALPAKVKQLIAVAHSPLALHELGVGTEGKDGQAHRG